MARTLIALALALVCATPAQAGVYTTGELGRGDAGPNSLEVTVTNASDSGEAFDFVRIELAPGTTASNVATGVSNAPAGCATQQPSVIQCQIPPPYLQPGATLDVTFAADPRLADGAGAAVSVCPHTCADAYTGPFLLEGPAPAKAPPAGALASVTRWRTDRVRAGDACTPARTLFAAAAVSICTARSGATLRGIVVNSGDSALPLTIFAPAYAKRVRVPTSGGAGFQRNGRLRRGAKLIFVNGLSGARATVKVRLPSKRRHG